MRTKTDEYGVEMVLLHVCVRVCEGARAFGNVSVAVCWCVCAGQFFDIKKKKNS